MKSVAILFTALVLALGAGVVVSSAATAPPAQAAGLQPVPEATTKKTPKPKATPTTATPTPLATTRRPIDEEGDRWVQLALVGGGGLLACVVVFFGVGTLRRRRPR